MKRWLCAWWIDWPIQRHLQADRRKTQHVNRTRPLVLHEPGRANGTRVVASCPRARELGIVPGLPIAEAMSLFTEAVSLDWRPMDAAADRAALEALAGWCERLSPWVALEEGPWPESLFLELTASGPGSEQQQARDWLKAWRQQGWRVRVGWADTLGAAWALAHAHAPCRPTIPCAPPGRSAEVLAPLPIELLRLPSEAQSTLIELGIRRIGELASLPRASLPARLGPELLHRLDQAMGHQTEMLSPIRPAPPLQATWNSDWPIDRRETVLAILGQLLDRLLGELLPDRGILRLEGTWRTERGREHVSLELAYPTRDRRRLSQLLELRLESVSLPAGILGLKLEAARTAPLELDAADLLDSLDGESSRETEAATMDLVERLSSRLGKAAVLGVDWVADAQPERSFTYRPALGGPRGRGNDPSSRPEMVAIQEARPRLPLAADRLLRPVRLLPPRRVLVEFAATSGVCPRPGQLLVRRLHGPERIETGWWRSQPIRRDYYRAETIDGRQYWLFCPTPGPVCTTTEPVPFLPPFSPDPRGEAARRAGEGEAGKVWYLHGVFE